MSMRSAPFRSNEQRPARSSRPRWWDCRRRPPACLRPVVAVGWSRWLVSVFGGADQRGRWRLSSRLRVVVVFGGVTLNLRTAQLEAPESVITVVAVLGGAWIIAPLGVPIQLSGFSMFGGKGDKRAAGPPLPGSPLVRVRAFPIFGGVTVKDHTVSRKLRELIRARRNKPTGT